MKYSKYLFAFALYILSSCANKIKTNKESSDINYYTQSAHNRMAAEWEPATGTLIVLGTMIVLY